MDFFRNLSPRGKRIAIVVAGAVAASLIIIVSRRRGGSAPAAAETAPANADAGAGLAGYGAGGTFPTTSLPNAGYDSGTSAGLADVQDAIDRLGDRIDAIPGPTGASDIAQAVGDLLGGTRGVDPASPATATTAPPVTESATPAAPIAPAPPAPRTPATGPVGGRRVGPWATAAMRDKAVAGIPGDRVRKYSLGGKFYAEIFG